MSKRENNWFVITGGPSTGKTSILFELEKLGFSTVPEAARMVIDQGIAEGRTIDQIRSDEKRFQLDVLKQKIKIERNQQKDIQTFFDRGMHDTVAYLQHKGFGFEDNVSKVMDDAFYQKVFVLEPLPFFEEDYARTESAIETQQLTVLLYETYDSYGMKPITVPFLSIEKRVELILNHISGLN